MPTVPLPDDPNLEQLRKQAKDLRDFARAGVSGALDLFAEHHPRGVTNVSLSDAQLVVARHYGFTSWAKLKHHLELVERYRRAPDEVETTDDASNEFLRLACLRYGGDDTPERWAGARRLLTEHPEISRSSVHAAAACADVAAAQSFLGHDDTLARLEGGPYGWEPILYLAYARHDPAINESTVLATAGVLLDAGADPNAGFLWHGLPTPFTVLTGVLGSGELGHGNQPPHPCAHSLAELLLDAGADPNDGQAVYDLQFSKDDSFLALLLDRGLGRGDGGPWRARLGHILDSPTELVRHQLWWAIVHGNRDRARLLVAHDVDIRTPFATTGNRPVWARTSDGRTPVEVAALNGSDEIVNDLVAAGAPPPALAGPDAFVAAALAVDRSAMDGLRDAATAAREQRPGLIVWAAGRGKGDAIPLLVDHGFDIDALGRSDAPVEQEWETALHVAAGKGDVELARLVLSLGADPNAHDTRFDQTPLGWARHFDHAAVAALLEPLTG